jgi:hypothetical protein
MLTTTHPVAISDTSTVQTNPTAENIHPIGYLPVKVPLDKNRKYAYVSFQGQCLDSPDSPIRLKDGCKILVHKVPEGERGLFEAMNKLVCFLYKGQLHCKHLIFANTNPFNGFLLLRSYNPVTTASIPLSQIKVLFVVDDVYSEK